MKPLFFLFLGSLLVLHLSCNRSNYTPQHPSEQYIRYGSGGGFTGAKTTYILMDNGQLFQQESLSDTTLLWPRVKRKEYRAIFTSLTQMDSSLLSLQHPGNRYFFIEWIRPEKQLQATWGSSDYQPPAALLELYQELMNLVKP